MCDNCNDDRPEFSRRGFLWIAGAAMALAAGGCKHEQSPKSAAVAAPKPPRPPTPDLGTEMFPDAHGRAIALPKDAPVIMLPRSAWTKARPNFEQIQLMNGISRLTVHHTGQKVDYKSTDFRQTIADIEDIRKFHTTDKERLWADIAYHFVIDPAGRCWQGRPLVYQGSHAKNANDHNIGIVVMGNFEVQKPSAQQLTSLAAFTEFLRDLYKIPAGGIFTHGELVKTTECPGKSLQAFVNRSRANWA